MNFRLKRIVPLLAVFSITTFLGLGLAWGQESGKESDQILLHEDFEKYGDGSPIGDNANWQAFPGFRGTPPRAVVAKNAGRDGGAALTVSHTEPFRGDNWGLARELAAPISGGVVWLECYFHPPSEWTGDMYFDARGGRSVIARIAATKYQSDDDPQPVLRAHASWSFSYWRMHRKLPLKADWYRLTMRVDCEQGTYAAWVDDQPLGEELTLCSQEPIDRIHLGLGGAPDSPALIDDLRILRTAPPGRELQDLLPKPESDLSFRMAVVGDPQLGFTDYQADVIRFEQTVQQINRSGAELTLVMGDMVHDKDNEQAYRDVKKIADQLDGPCYFVRGNHDRLDLYQQVFHERADFSFTHKGWRFVFLDATGNESGVTSEQLAFVDKELEAAEKAGEKTVVGLHVSPWQDNDKGRGGYNQIGPGRDRLVELLDQYGVLFCLSGHYHRGWWHVQQQATHYMVFGGTSQVKQGWLGWCVFDVYPDRVEIHQKPVYFAYERADAKEFYNFNYGQWTTYEETLEKYPYQQRGPATIPYR